MAKNKKAKAKAKAIKGGMPQNVADRVFKMTPGKPGRQMSNSAFSYKNEQVMAEMPGFFKKIAKGARTLARGAGDIGVQVLDFLQPDIKNIGGSTNSFNMGGLREAKRNAHRAKDFENEHYDKSRQMVKEGKIYGTLADFFDDDGRGGSRKGK